jgi:hypothetical protein
MESDKKNWILGETATLTKQERSLKQSGSTAYVQYITSRYICIREATDTERGILVKVLGKCNSDPIRIVGGAPFFNDFHDELFTGDSYSSYPFPLAKDVQEVLEILKFNQDLLQKFEAAKMHINPEATFWVSDTTRNKLFQKKLQILSGRDGELHPADDDDVRHYRLSLVYFFKGALVW